MIKFKSLNRNEDFIKILKKKKLNTKYFTIYFEKNLALISNIAKGYRVIFEYDTINNFPTIDYARDNEHPGPDSHKLFAVQMYNQYLNQVIYDDEEKSKFLEDFLTKLDEK